MKRRAAGVVAAVALAGCVSTPQVMHADLSDAGRYDKVWNAAIREAAKMQFTLTTENKSAGELRFDQHIAPPYKESYWILVSFGEVKAGADTEIKVRCDQQTATADVAEDVFNSLINPISRDQCKQMREAIAKALTE